MHAGVERAVLDLGELPDKIHFLPGHWSVFIYLLNMKTVIFFFKGFMSLCFKQLFFFFRNFHYGF